MKTQITINGQSLTEAQSTTLRVALESFAVILSENGLGDDQHGKHMTKLYKERISEIRKIIF